MNVQVLLERAKMNGLTVSMKDGRLKVAAPQEPQGEVKALIQELRSYRDEIKAILLVPACWNCGQGMAPITDISGKATHYCPACEMSTEDLEALPHLPRAWKVEEIRSESGEIRAVRICSALLQDHLWVIIDRSFEPKDGLAIYYPEELPQLKARTPDDLRQIHAAKLAFPGSRIIQDGDLVASK